MTYWHNHHAQTSSASSQANHPLKQTAIVIVGFFIALIAFASISVLPFEHSIPFNAKAGLILFGLILLGCSYRYTHIFRMYMIFLVFGAAFGMTTIGIIV